MADAPKTDTPPAAVQKPATKKVFCFVSKHDIDEADAVEMPYANGQKMWVGKAYVKFKDLPDAERRTAIARELAPLNVA